MMWLFILSVLALFAYRFVSMWKIYDMMKTGQDGEKSVMAVQQSQRASAVQHTQIQSASVTNLDDIEAGASNETAEDQKAASSVGSSLWKRLVFQFLDIEILRIVGLSIEAGISGTSSPQRVLRALECVFEAAPQVQF